MLYGNYRSLEYVLEDMWVADRMLIELSLVLRHKVRRYTNVYLQCRCYH